MNDYNMKEVTIKIEKQLPSERNSIREVEPIMFKIRDKIYIGDDKFFSIMIAATEAVNNAIIHGNKLDNRKIVSMVVEASSQLITIEVKDSGNGFDFNDIADPRIPENLLKEGGRGIFLIRQIADRVEFCCSNSGSKVYMEFDL